jgi:hypothetical protein
MESISHIDKILNINYLDQSNISLSKALMIFYVLVASNYTGSLLSKQLKESIENNRYAQHIIGFIMMLVIITMVGGVSDIDKTIIYSVLAYVWFIMTTKIDLHWNIIIILLMLCGYLYENKIKQKEKLLENDSSMSNGEKNKIKIKHTERKTYIVLGIVGVTAIGMYMYLTKKQNQYGVQSGGGAEFDPIVFLLN